ncbi:maleylpyruvate isomerase family mycothiol-dependent enzyme [Nocardia sp. NBC_01329]|uniref:maleylpyruvate isomerase family mycothiol-dependent enzyme n=1 Tax=Nocardia sp. NBC_01329 TaxID=2903594 RepID=UPI002E159B3B|nr:maleylpyruvate isomerase family mycothiol-dependent enzyme [Nocardia sp. NBC_01329]
MENVWPTVRSERTALIADLEGLTGEQWATPSLCSGWTVHDVLAHIVATAKTSVPVFCWQFARARFDFDRFTENGVERERAATPAETLDRLRAVLDRTVTPPAPRDSRLVEMIVHGEDIRRPLGITREYPVQATADALRLQLRTSASFGGGKELAAGLTLAAEDAEFTSGSGPQVRGPLLSLLLVFSARAVAVADLHGDGLDTLRRRLESGAS